MRIGITCYPTYGGSGAVATELGIELARRGHEIHFISYAQPFRLTHFLEGVFFHEVEVNRYPLFEYPPYSLALAVSIHEVVRRQGLDLLHAHYAVPHATAAWIAREMLRAEGGNVKLVTTLHGTDITLVGQDPSFRSITKFSIEGSDGLTAVSRYLKAETHRAFGCRECDIRVIPNFVDPDLYDRERHECGNTLLSDESQKILMHISNFRPVKRISDVIRIFARVAERVDSRLVLIGDGPDRPLADELVSSLGLEARVLFLGKLESVSELLVCADLFLLPSEQESFGLVALEAQVAGVPVVGTKNSGLAEVVEDGTTGALHPVGDVESMADSAVRFLLHRDVWERASRAARRRAVERFSAHRIVPLYEAFYEEVLRGAVASSTGSGNPV
ncbi:MAG: N-acetyl-alpha-D-glucosaminyl L-malate synthase BshA [Gemmatimonadota bacterium]